MSRQQHLHHSHEFVMLAQRQRLEHTLLRTQHGRRHVAQQFLALGRELQESHSTIIGVGVTGQQAARLQSIDDAADGGGVKPDGAGQGALIKAR